MSEVVGEGVIHIRTDSAGVNVSGAGAEAGRGYTKGFLGSLKGLALGIGGVLAAREVIGFAKDAVAEGREAQKVGAATTQIIKSTGSAANVTASQVGDLSTALSNKIGVDDEAIQSGANLLLTFKNVRNEAGLGNDVFNRTVAATQDVAAAGFGSIDSASKALGKALNDPVKGITALGRAGITFTASQQDQIKALVASNDLLGAQKIILGEVEGQVGGVAEATATSGEKAQTAWKNLEEQIGTALLPILDKVENAFASKIVPAISDVVSGTSAVSPAFRAVADGMGAAIDLIGPQLHDLVNGVKVFIRTLEGKGGTLDSNGIFVKVGLAAGRFAKGALPAVIDSAKKVIHIIVDLAKKLGGDLLQSFENLRPVLEPLAKDILGLVQSFRLSELKIIVTVLSKLGDLLVGVTGFLGDHATTVQAVAVAILTMVAAYKAYQLGLAVVRVATAAFAAVQAALNVVMDANPIGLLVLALVGLTAGLIYAYKHSDKFRSIVDALGHTITSIFGGIIDFFKDHWVLIVSLIGGPIVAVAIQVIKHFGAIKDKVHDVIDFVKGVPDDIAGLASDMKDAGARFIEGLFHGITGAAGKAGGVVADIASDVFSAVTGMINDAIDLINDGIPNSIGAGPVKIDLPNDPIPHLAGGTSNWPGGWSWVGEEGPELVNVPRGAQVVPAARSAALVASGGGGAAAIHVEHMHVQPHNYSEFIRQTEQDARVAQLGNRRPGGVRPVFQT